MNLCRACDLDFHALGGFDGHRIGKHAYVASAEKPDGRRCLSVEEMIDRGWSQDQHGRWRMPATNRQGRKRSFLRSG